MKILLTNDDSHFSPLFHLAIELLADYGDLTIVVPKEEQSWKGKSMTITRPLYVDELEICGQRSFCLGGTPADCVNWGLYHSGDGKPDLVVSGINIGLNTGIGFTLASGTIGACLEGNIAGVPGIALSQLCPPEAFDCWRNERSFSSEILEHIESTIRGLIGNTLATIMSSSSLTTQPITWNVNFPWEPSPDCELRQAKIGSTFYGSCFVRQGDRFVHQLSHVHSDESVSSDGSTLLSGHVSVSAIDLRGLQERSTETCLYKQPQLIPNDKS